MTAAARITQADIDRVTKSAKATYGERAKIVFNFQDGTAAIIPGQIGDEIEVAPNPWDEE